MTRRHVLATVTILTFALCGDAVARQSTSAPSGHWVGTLEAGASLGVEVDLARQGAGAWRGTFSVPAQGQKVVPLADITVKSTSVEFAGDEIAGTWTQGPLPLPLVFRRKP